MDFDSDDDDVCDNDNGFENIKVSPNWEPEPDESSPTVELGLHLDRLALVHSKVPRSRGVEVTPL